MRDGEAQRREIVGIGGAGCAYLFLLPLREKVGPKGSDEGFCDGGLGPQFNARRDPSSDLALLGHLLPQGEKGRLLEREKEKGWAAAKEKARSGFPGRALICQPRLEPYYRLPAPAPGTRGLGAGSRPSRWARLRASLRARRMASAF